MWHVRKEESCIEILVERPEENKSYERSRSRWKDKTEIYLPETG
jgi:hypothetical protein